MRVMFCDLWSKSLLKGGLFGFFEKKSKINTTS